MIEIPRRTSTWAVLALGIAVLVSGGCRTVPIANLDEPLGPPASTSLDDIGREIAAAGEDLGWVIELEAPGHATGTLQLRSHLAIVDITYSKTRLGIRYRSSENLLKQGDRIHSRYNTWVDNLSARIQERVATLATNQHR